MATLFTIERLTSIAQEIIGDPSIELTPDMSAADVPGWDSLNHTLITFELARETKVTLSAEETATVATFGALVALVNARIAA